MRDSTKHRQWWPQALGRSTNEAAAVARQSQAPEPNYTALLAPAQMQTQSAAIALSALDLNAPMLRWTEATVMADRLPESMLPSSATCLAEPTPAQQQPPPPIFPQPPASTQVKETLLYAAVFLTAASRDMLALLVPPLHTNVQADHMLVKTQPAHEDLVKLPMGAEVALQVTGAAADHVAQAVLVTPPIWLACPDCPGPHITVSKSALANDGYGGVLLMEGLAGLNTCFHQLHEPFMVYGRLGVATSANRTLYSMQELVQLSALAPQPPQQATAVPQQLTSPAAPSPKHTAQTAVATTQYKPPSPAPMQACPGSGVGSLWAPQQPVPASKDFPVLAQPPSSARSQAGLGKPTPTKHASGNDAALAANGTANSTASLPVLGSKLSLKDFLADTSSRPKQGSGMASRAASNPGAGSSAAGDGGAGEVSGRVCWLQLLGKGDWVEVVPLVASAHPAGFETTHSAASMQLPVEEGFVEEILAEEEQYQPDGVLVRLHDSNTIGYVARVVGKQGPAAAEASRAHTRRQREQEDGLGNRSFGTGLTKKAGSGKGPTQGPQQHAAQTGAGSGGPAPRGSADGGGGASGADEDPDNPASSVWQRYKEQYGEALTAAVLEDCEGNVEQAVATLDEQANLLNQGSLEALDQLVARAMSKAAASASSKLAAEAKEDQQRRAKRQAAHSAQAGPAQPGAGGRVWAGDAQAGPQFLLQKSAAPARQFDRRDGPAGPSAQATPAAAGSTFAGKVYKRTADDDLEQAAGALHWRNAALQGRATSYRRELSPPRQQAVPSASAFPPMVKVLRRPDSLATTAAQAGQHIRSAEALKALLPGYSSQAVVSALAQAGGDVNRAADVLLASGPPTEIDVAQAAVAGRAMWDSSSSSSEDEDEEPPRAQLQDTTAAAVVVGGPASERSAKVTQLVQAFEGLDRSLAEFLLRQCGGDVERTSRYILEEVLGSGSAAGPAAKPAAPAAKQPARSPTSAGSSSGGGAPALAPAASVSRTVAAPAHGDSARGRNTWEVVPRSADRKPRRRVHQYVVGDTNNPETDQERMTHRRTAEQERQMAQICYDARNVYFRRAAAAYSAGDGRMAAELSRKGRDLSKQAHKHRDLANEAAYRATNTSIRNQYVMDLHFMYVEEALGTLRHTLATLESLGSPKGLELKVITGIGHHSVNNIPVIKNSVLAWLKERGVRHYVDPSNEGVVCVQLGAR